jgi:lipoyl(octanoyl) transferase
MGEEWYRMQGIDIVETDRGGKVTYHGPGQLVGYPILAVADIIAYVRTLEDAIVNALEHEQIEAHSRPEDGPDFTGVWVQDRKIASIGVHVRSGITTHGFAVNVENDLQPFTYVVPCGLDGVQMTSIVKETQGTTAGIEAFRPRMAGALTVALEREAEQVTLQRIEQAVGALA